MIDYLFILGRNSQLSTAEIKAVFPEGEIKALDQAFLVLSLNKEIDCQNVLASLGGSIKISQVIGEKFSVKKIISELKSEKTSGKINFGFSFYNTRPDNEIGLEIKKLLKKEGISSRLVVSREKALSSVVVAKNKCHEFIVALSGGQSYLAKTCVVQEFEEYSKRDYGRPNRDMLSGSLPPKLAQIMINLAQVGKNKILLDPFCGSGTILQEALLMGYKKVIGSDISSKAITESRQNLEWLKENYEVHISNVELFNTPVQNIIDKFTKVDAIVTEPFLGPPLKGYESIAEVKRIIQDLEKLYLEAFEQFEKILSSSGKVVIVFPYFKKFDLTLQILPAIKKMGFNPINSQKLFYSRPDQKVWRHIKIWKKN